MHAFNMQGVSGFKPCFGGEELSRAVAALTGDVVGGTIRVGLLLRRATWAMSTRAQKCRFCCLSMPKSILLVLCMHN